MAMLAECPGTGIFHYGIITHIPTAYPDKYDPVDAVPGAGTAYKHLTRSIQIV
jgi:hypothetical protein